MGVSVGSVLGGIFRVNKYLVVLVRQCVNVVFA